MCGPKIDQIDKRINVPTKEEISHRKKQKEEVRWLKKSVKPGKGKKWIKEGEISNWIFSCYASVMSSWDGVNNLKKCYF